MNPITEQLKEEWSSKLQRRVFRLLLLHEKEFFRSKFDKFYRNSALPTIPLLQQYDRYIKLVSLSDELLKNILPRIHRRLSLQPTHTYRKESAPTQGTINWYTTIKKSWQETPGQSPLHFHTKLRKHDIETPENILTVAILLTYRHELQVVRKEGLGDEQLDQQEKLFLTKVDDQIERELAGTYAKQLLLKAKKSHIPTLIQQVQRRITTGANPYKKLLDWWKQVQTLRIGRSSAQEKAVALTSKREDKKVDAWLYELWIALEFAHFLYKNHALRIEETRIEEDTLQFIFVWQERSFQFRYNRSRETESWENAPGVRPDYLIERLKEEQICIMDGNKIIWNEPSVIMDAKFYVSQNKGLQELPHEPVKKLLGDMSLLFVPHIILFFPMLADDDTKQKFYPIKPKEHVYHVGWQQERELLLYELRPEMDPNIIQKVIEETIEYAVKNLPERSQPKCEGILCDTRSKNASNAQAQTNMVICRKRHIGENVFDIVDRDKDCLLNPKLCHLKNKNIEKPNLSYTDHILNE